MNIKRLQISDKNVLIPLQAFSVIKVGSLAGSFIITGTVTIGVQWSPSNKDTPSAKQFCPY